MHYKPQYVLTSVLTIAVRTDSPNQRPSEIVEGKVLLIKR